MKCRECDGSFEERCEDGISCMVCLKCELLWFSQGQVERAKIRSDKFGKFFKGIEFSGSPIELVDPMCPACDQKLHRHKHATAPHIEVSDCYGCGGKLFSSDQITEIRENSMNDEQLEAYRDQIAHSIPEYTVAEHKMVKRGGLGGFAQTWEKMKFWKKNG